MYQRRRRRHTAQPGHESAELRGNVNYLHSLTNCTDVAIVELVDCRLTQPVLKLMAKEDLAGKISLCSQGVPDDLIRPDRPGKALAAKGKRRADVVKMGETNVEKGGASTRARR